MDISKLSYLPASCQEKSLVYMFWMWIDEYECDECMQRANNLINKQCRPLIRARQ
jgi:hypothetical protein